MRPTHHLNKRIQLPDRKLFHQLRVEPPLETRPKQLLLIPIPPIQLTLGSPPRPPQDIIRTRLKIPLLQKHLPRRREEPRNRPLTGCGISPWVRSLHQSPSSSGGSNLSTRASSSFTAARASSGPLNRSASCAFAT